MSTGTHVIDVRTCLEHLYRAMNSRDVEAMLQCLQETYASEQPRTPTDAFAAMRKSGRIGRRFSLGCQTSKPSYCVRWRQTTCCGPNGGGTARGQMGVRSRCGGLSCEESKRDALPGAACIWSLSS